MPFLFVCPQCGDRRSMGQQSLGRRVRCPSCDSLIEVVLNDTTELAELTPQGTTPVTAELAEARLKIITGVAVSIPELNRERNLQGTDTIPGVPVLAMDDEEEEAAESPVVMRSKPEEADMDMTPMVDVTFLLLIFFMVTASFTVQKSLPMPAPKDKEAASSPTPTLQEMEDDSDMVTVRVDSFGTFFVLGPAWEDEIECPSEQELIMRIKEAKRGDGLGNFAKKLLVLAHGDAKHERVVMAVDAGVTAEIDNVQLATTEEDEAQ